MLAGVHTAVIRPDGDGRAAPRFVRLTLSTTTYGVRGSGVITVDRSTGRFVRRFDSGATSEREGFDGRHAWRADATGWPRIEGNVDEAGAVIAWGDAFAGTLPRTVRAMTSDARRDTCLVRYARVSRGVEVAVDRASGLVERFTRRIGATVDTTSFSDYRTVDGVIVPFALTDRSDNGVWAAEVTGVQTARALGDAAFEPPVEPRDWSLDRTTRVPFVDDGIPIVPVRINGGAPLRLILDTGGQNVITPRAARRVGMTVVGGGTVGGAGAGLAGIRYATARTVRVGAAEMRHQPFLVLELGNTFPYDGVVGYELLARFAARLDFRRKRLDLAPDVRALNPAARPLAFTFDERQPQLDGAIDGLRGVLTIDTGSSSSLDVTAPFVRAHDLLRRYHAHVSGLLLSGVGGAVRGTLAHGVDLRLGWAHVRDYRMIFTDARQGVEADASIAANVGDQVMRRFVTVFDYRHQRMWLEPGGERHAQEWSDRSGVLLGTRGGRLRVGDVLTSTPGWNAHVPVGGIIVAVNGRAVTGRDRTRVRQTLAGAPGAAVSLRFADGRLVRLRLAQYFR